MKGEKTDGTGKTAPPLPKIMDFFKSFASATSAGMGVQSWFDSHGRSASRMFYRCEADADTFSILYSNIVDSTIADGSVSRREMLIDEWKIFSLRVGGFNSDGHDFETDGADVYTDVTFDGSTSKTVHVGEVFCTDEFHLDIKKGEYFCIEIVYEGNMIPCHPEICVPCFTQTDGRWQRTGDAPVPSMIGYKPLTKRLPQMAFWGDSITQGCGTPNNSYSHYAALIHDMLGDKIDVWDIALGYARGNDAAACGAWLYKAKQNDIVSVCFGVNDILWSSRTPEEICGDIKKIVLELKTAGCKVLLQYLPPFSFEEEQAVRWLALNELLRNEVAKECDACFDCAPLIGQYPEKPYQHKYGAHPNEEGHRIWSRALAPVIEAML